MKKDKFVIQGIPAILWGEASDKLFIAVHGNMSSKDDTAIVIFAEEAIAKGYQVLSFDLPEHGERKGQADLCKVQNCVSELTTIGEYARTISSNINVFACSIGAYFSLLAYRNRPLGQCLFLSPVLDMERIINKMMAWFKISVDRLEAEKEIQTPIEQRIYWDYYCYVKAHPIDIWQVPTAILYGSDDNLTEIDVVSDFVERYHCKLDVLEGGEHYFHTDEQLNYFRQWLRNNIL